jgi:hypothetical protein
VGGACSGEGVLATKQGFTFVQAGWTGGKEEEGGEGGLVGVRLCSTKSTRDSAVESRLGAHALLCVLHSWETSQAPIAGIVPASRSAQSCRVVSA